MRALFSICFLLCLVCPSSVSAQHHNAQGIALGWYTDVSRKVLSQFRGAKIVHLQRKYGIRRATAIVQFVAHKTGRIESARIAQSSGNAAFDRTIENIVRSMRLPPIPAGFTNQRVALSQALQFH
ncbi:TonB family protein [Pseudorhodoplanes sinuspersici]|uniref:TonB C-terminal domain-containing protein n=1 Tax=Pseudorhodoplanes sinuspersici TaxID=1235591 RepID=A0A1W6ZT34_9HYPH|nr:TonB family protein [Pseudorhodoplanes sinuspersici]ARQ00503.1 hypothetical protein CAK95_16530 [Pseudorhodoplanes sinuspersici]